MTRKPRIKEFTAREALVAIIKVGPRARVFMEEVGGKPNVRPRAEKYSKRDEEGFLL